MGLYHSRATLHTILSMGNHGPGTGDRSYSGGLDAKSRNKLQMVRGVWD